MTSSVVAELLPSNVSDLDTCLGACSNTNTGAPADVTANPAASNAPNTVAESDRSANLAS